MSQARTLQDQDRRTIEALLKAGRTIEAIKVYRQATGADLVTAKGAIDGMRATGAGGVPKPIGPTGGGCLVLLVALSTTLVLMA